jgi:hypothetical protein
VTSEDCLLRKSKAAGPGPAQAFWGAFEELFSLLFKAFRSPLSTVDMSRSVE